MSALFLAVADVLDGLPQHVRAERERRGLSLRTAGAEIGVSFSTLARLEAGVTTDLAIVRAVLRWLGGEPSPRTVRAYQRHLDAPLDPPAPAAAVPVADTEERCKENPDIVMLHGMRCEVTEDWARHRHTPVADTEEAQR